MHDAAFASAALPSPTRILGLELRPYSIGHEIALQREGSPFVSSLTNDAIAPEEVARAVWVCCLSWREIRTERCRRWLSLKNRAWSVLVRGWDFEAAECALWDYLRIGSEWAPARRNQEDASRPLGGPEAARLIQFLIRVLGKCEAEAFDYPLALANWHYATFLENEGACKILNEDESEFLAWCRDQDARDARKRKASLPSLGATARRSVNGSEGGDA